MAYVYLRTGSIGQEFTVFPSSAIANLGMARAKFRRRSWSEKLVLALFMRLHLMHYLMHLGIDKDLRYMYM